MALKFHCPNCKGEIVSKYLGESDIIKCPDCNSDVKIPSNAQATNEDSTLLKPVPFGYKDEFEPEHVKNKNKNPYMNESQPLAKQIGIVAAIAGVLSFLFLPMISSFIGNASGSEVIGEAFKSKDSEGILLGFWLIAIVGCGVISAVLYGSGKVKEGASSAGIGFAGLIISVIFFMVKTESVEAVKLFGAGIWVSIICYLASALAPQLFRTSTVTSTETQFCSECGTKIDASDQFCPSCGQKIVG